MARAIVMRAVGAPEVLRVEDVEVGEPGPGQVRVRQTVAGVNFHDIYVRTGLYKTLQLPGIPGLEAVGTVATVGPGVNQLFGAIAEGIVRPGTPHEYRMEAAGRAQQDMEERRTSGAVILRL